MRAEVVGPGVWFVQGVAALGSPANRNFISNAGFVVTPDGVVVVDALGSPALAKDLLALIRLHTPQPVRWLVLTHCHADHLYGLQVFAEAGARVLAHRACLDYLGSEAARLRLEDSRRALAPWIDDATRLVRPDAVIGERGESEHVLALAGRRIVVRHVGPAHTPEDLVVHDEASGVLFAGDLVFRGRVPFVGQADSGRWLQALDLLLGLAPRVIVPGHGAASVAPVADLQGTREYLAFLRQAMGEAAERMEPFDEAYARVDWSRFARWPLFEAANRINAYNTYLLLEREAAAPARR
jgi:glyoxylase-like metal-dependent hydrolase (beta-lactamase superfamily II)